MKPATRSDRPWRRRPAFLLPLILVGALAAGTGEAPARSTTGGPAVSTQSTAAAASKHRLVNGFGQNQPRYDDRQARWNYRCVKEQTNFKVTVASIVMWSRGNRIKGFQFKYRLVAHGTAGQPQWWSNWSANSTRSFKQGQAKSYWMNAPGLGQSFSSASAWDMEIKLKFPRSLRKAYRYKYRYPVSSPQCGALAP